MKLIKFDLPIDGVKVKTVDELREHFTPEILDHFRSGLLAKWLVSRKLQDELEAVKALEGVEDPLLLKGLCEIFSVDVDEEVIAAVLQKPLHSGQNILELIGYNRRMAEKLKEVESQRDKFKNILSSQIESEREKIFRICEGDFINQGCGGVYEALFRAMYHVRLMQIVLKLDDSMSGFYGQDYVIINDGGYESYNIFVSVGQKVKIGNLIAKTSESGSKIWSPCDGLIREVFLAPFPEKHGNHGSGAFLFAIISTKMAGQIKFPEKHLLRKVNAVNAYVSSVILL